MLTTSQLDEALTSFWKGWKGPGRLLFAKVWGSYSHNCATEKSDLDILAVYQSPTREVLGLRDVRETVEAKVADGSPFDLEAHEVGKFCRLVLKGGPAALEALFTTRMRLMTQSFAELMDRGARFLSVRAVRQYLGYAEGQLKKLANGQSLHTKGGRMSEKWSYHFSRLVDDARRVASKQPPLVWKEGAERDALMKIRNGETSASVATTEAAAAIAQLRESEADWLVPPEPDEAWVNDWLVRQRLQDLEESIFKGR